MSISVTQFPIEVGVRLPLLVTITQFPIEVGVSLYKNTTETLNAIDVTNFSTPSNEITETLVTDDTTDVGESSWAGSVSETDPILDISDDSGSIFVTNIFESSNAVDVVGTLQDDIEICNASDITNAIYVSNNIISENGSASDATDSYGIPIISESGNAVDTTNTNAILNVSVFETESAFDAIGIEYDVQINETETTSDTTDAIDVVNVFEFVSAQDSVDSTYYITFANVAESIDANDSTSTIFNILNSDVEEYCFIQDVADQIPMISEVIVAQDSTNVTNFSSDQITEFCDTEDITDQIPMVSEVVYTQDFPNVGISQWAGQIIEFYDAEDITDQIPMVSEVVYTQDFPNVGISRWIASVSEVMDAQDFAGASPSIQEILNAQDATDVTISQWVGNIVEVGSATDFASAIPMVPEVLDAQDSIYTRFDIWVGLVSEIEFISDSTSTIPMVTEVMNAQDQTNYVFSLGASVVETMNAVDTVSVSRVLTANVIEAGFLYDMTDTANFDVSVFEVCNAEDFTSVIGTEVNEFGNLIDTVDAGASYQVSITEMLFASDTCDYALAIIESLFTADFVDAIKVPGNIIVPGTGIVPGFPMPPNVCGVFGLVETNGLFSNQIYMNALTLGVQINVLIVGLNGIPQSVLDQVTLDIPTLVSDLNNVLTVNLTPFATHLNNQITNLIPNLNMAVGQLATQMGLLNSGGSLPSLGSIGAPGTNPCAAMDLYFGSIMGDGQTLITQMTGYVTAAQMDVSNIETATSGLQEIADDITSQVASIVTTGAAMTTMQNNETTQLSSGGGDIGNITTTNTVFGFMANPVAATVVSGNATEELSPFLANTIVIPVENPTGA